jgi:Protein of unknown function (DUF3592)
MMEYVPTGDLFGGVIALVVGALALRVIIPQIGHHLRVLRSGRWPIAHGRVQKGEILHSGPTNYLRYVPYRALLGYAYEVAGREYSGLFVLAAEDAQTAEKLQKKLNGTEVKVQYDPKNPEISFLVDKELVGRRVVQDPMWFDS